MLLILIAILMLASAYCFWAAEQTRKQVKFNGNFFQTPVKYEEVKAKGRFGKWWAKPRFSIRGITFFLISSYIWNIIFYVIKHWPG